MAPKLYEVVACFFEGGIEVQAWSTACTTRQYSFVLGECHHGSVEAFCNPLRNQAHNTLVPVGVVQHQGKIVGEIQGHFFGHFKGLVNHVPFGASPGRVEVLQILAVLINGDAVGGD